VQQHAESVVLEAAEAVPAAFDLVHAQVQPLGQPVGGAAAVVLEDLGPPRGQGAAEGADLLDVVLRTAGDGLVHQQRGLVGILGEVDVPHRFLGQSGAEDLVVGIADPQAQQHPMVAALVEALGPGQ
jgi:hypothetical protein